MGAILSILKLEIKSYLTNTSALFWTFIYPILMLLLLVFVFSKNTTEVFYFNSIIGLMGLLIISSAIFGLTQAIASSRSHNVFLFYILSPATLKQVTIALIVSRLIIVIIYAFTFIGISFYTLNIFDLLNFKTLIFGFISIFSSSFFCFCLAIFVAKILQNEQSILGFANIINLYAVMSCNVFVSLDYLPSIGQLFIKTSVFYKLNQLLLKSFQGIDPILILITSTLFIVCGITLFLLSANRMLLIERMR
ncbi:ABC-type multidrug transport system, permease component [Helicobacter pylori Cuz20]|uniref:ABC-type multidrug transport system, permease component n=1 Tax=Helicobacter pylori (strain Cuz20) TaxID=765964 RepID=A0AB32X7P7_HELPC|nr:ABC transporter permease [Helicobacter pylori]ADO03831.1 ABC-type multidrug transport system, permease component [Helicobacter pylori Cuz20]